MSLLGVFILFSDFKNKINIIYFFIILSLIIWILADFASWSVSDPKYILWSEWAATIGILGVALIALFLHIFPEGKKITVKTLITIFLPLLPVMVLVPTKYYVIGIRPAPSCETITGPLFFYIIFLLLFYILLIFTSIFRKYRKIEENYRKQLRIFIIGTILLVFFAIIFNIIPTIYGGSDTLTILTPIGGLVFTAFCAFAIVRYKAFNVKVIAAQMLTVVTWVLIGSQFFFAQNTTSIVLTGLTLAMSLGFGYILIKSVKVEVQRKEELQLMADKLAQANDTLRKLDNAKTEFISIASHQLRTPITAIKGFSSLLLEGSYGEVSEDVRGALNKIYVSTERLVNLIEDLLNVSRIESGRLTFAFEPASVEKLLKELYENFLLIAKNKKFYLDLKLPEVAIPEIVMDYTKIRELVSNFIDNALKYTEKGGVTIKSELKDEGVVIDEHGFVIDGKVSPYGKVMRIIVSDTGIGIPKDEIPYLFKKFSRGKDVSRLHVGGTGLGLYVGKAIAEAHNGQVWVESDGAGLGSRFIIEIPTQRPVDNTKQVKDLIQSL